MIVKQIIYFGQPATLACDARCEKAWGVHNRPRIISADDPDDFVYLADDELDLAPADPGTYEGGHGKPQTPDERLNKWCARECERSILVSSRDGVCALPNFTERMRRNFPE